MNGETPPPEKVDILCFFYFCPPYQRCNDLFQAGLAALYASAFPEEVEALVMIDMAGMPPRFRSSLSKQQLQTRSIIILLVD